MGYCYTQSGALVCDRCGTGGGCRKRTCTHKSAYLFFDAGTPRIGYLPSCQPPALCQPCWEALGKGKLHDPCKERATLVSARELAAFDQLKAGDAKLKSQWGDWFHSVPSGFVGMGFKGLSGAEEYRLRPKDTDSPEWQPWDFTVTPPSKEVDLC